ncbi:22286_t:CDS:2, partial [Cetraspora pellucida]
DIPILQEISDEEIGSEYTEEISTIRTKLITPCIIIDNDYGEIRCYAVNGVNRELQFLGCYEKNDEHLHIRMGTGAKKDSGCIAMHLDDIETALCHFVKLIEMVAHSENEVTKKNLLRILILCLENFDLDSSSAPSQLSSLFVVNTIFKIKRLDFSKQQFIQKPKKYEEFGKLLALEVLRSRTSLAPCKLILEYPDSLQQYYEIIPKCLTSFFDGLVLTLQLKKYEIVKQKQKERKTPSTTNIDLCGKNLVVEQWTEMLTQIFNQLITEYPLGFAIDKINTVLKEVVGKGCNVSLSTVIILEAEPVPNSNLAVHKTCEIYIEDLKLNQGDSLDIVNRKEALWKLVNKLSEEIFSDESEKHPLFEISDQLTPSRYECMFTCYNKGVIRITNIVKQDILKQETHIAKE